MTARWNELLSRLPGAHILQTQEWGQVKILNGWQPYYLLWSRPAGAESGPLKFHDFGSQGPIDSLDPGLKISAVALLLVRSAGLPVSVSVAYCPKGPILDWTDPQLMGQVLQDLEATARNKGAIFLKIDPDVELGRGVPGQEDFRSDPVGESLVESLRSRGWRESGEQIQFRNTVVLDLARSLDEIMAAFKQKTRYNIRLATRKGVVIRTGSTDDINNLYQMYAETAVRDGFTIRGLEYYQKTWGSFFRLSEDRRAVELPSSLDNPGALPLIAELNGQPIAALILYKFAARGWFLFGMSRGEHRNKMPNYLLQWEAIQTLKESGCTSYDLWGAPDQFNESDPLWGVFRFKSGFNGEVRRYIAAWDLPLRPLWYRIYTQVLPGVLDIMRSRGNQATRRDIESG